MLALEEAIRNIKGAVALGFPEGLPEVRDLH